GQSVTLTATVSPSSAGGAVTFKDGSTTLGTGSLASGQATFTTSSLAAGSHSLTAVYGGDTNDQTSTSSALTQAVRNTTTTTLSVTPTGNPTFGSAITITATLSPGSATGEVEFFD